MAAPCARCKHPEHVGYCNVQVMGTDVSGQCLCFKRSNKLDTTPGFARRRRPLTDGKAV